MVDTSKKWLSTLSGEWDLMRGDTRGKLKLNRSLRLGSAAYKRLTLNKNKEREVTIEAVKPLVDLAAENTMVVLSSHATIEENKSSAGSYDAIPPLTTLDRLCKLQKNKES
ncbi:hypothetical protein Bca101_027821 [Brassica carinata]